MAGSRLLGLLGGGTFQAPSDGHYVFTTFETDPTTDSAIVLLDGGAESACNADLGVFGSALPCYETAVVHVDLTAGQEVQVAVEGQSGPGDFQLTVRMATVDGADCCAEQTSAGCSVQSIADCTCQADPYCCQTAWDQFCVPLGIAACDDLCSS